MSGAVEVALQLLGLVSDGETQRGPRSNRPSARAATGRARGDGCAQRWGWPGSGETLSFRDYVLTRKYDFGRGSDAAWRFIALARGDRALPDIADRQELDAYLARTGLMGEMRVGAYSTWRSYTAYRSRMRGAARGGDG